VPSCIMSRFQSTACDGNKVPNSLRVTGRVMRSATLAVCLAWPLFGCQTIKGIPVHRVPPELLGISKEGMQDISMSRLRQNPPKVYQLGPQDVLGVYIENVLGTRKTRLRYISMKRGTVPRHSGFQSRSVRTERWRCP